MIEMSLVDQIRGPGLGANSSRRDPVPIRPERAYETAGVAAHAMKAHSSAPQLGISGLDGTCGERGAVEEDESYPTGPIARPPNREI
jgi:hypothetical protein